MKIKLYIKSILLMYLIGMMLGCGGSDGYNPPNNITSPIEGSWISEQCDQLKDSNGDFVSAWGRANYTFSPSGQFTATSKIYNDASCVNMTQEIEGSGGASIDVRDIGEETTPEGLDGYRMGVTITTGADTRDYEFLYVITADARLCTSNNLRFRASKFSVSGVPITGIIFTECLVR